MSAGAIGGMNVLEGALRKSANRDERMGDVDFPRDGMVLSLLSPESWGVVNAVAEGGRAMEKFCEDFLCGIFLAIED